MVTGLLDVIPILGRTRPYIIYHHIPPGESQGGLISPPVYHWVEIYRSANGHSYSHKCFFPNIRVSHYIFTVKETFQMKTFWHILPLIIIRLSRTECGVDSFVFLRWIMLLVPCVTHLTDHCWRVKYLRQTAYSALTVTLSQTNPWSFYRQFPVLSCAAHLRQLQAPQMSSYGSSPGWIFTFALASALLLSSSSFPHQQSELIISIWRLT